MKKEDKAKSSQGESWIQRHPKTVVAGMTGLGATAILTALTLFSPTPPDKNSDPDLSRTTQKTPTNVGSITQEEIDRVYNNTFAYIAKHRALAEKEKKKLLVVLGETHEDGKSYVANAIALRAARENGMEDLVLETSNTERKRWENSKQQLGFRFNKTFLHALDSANVIKGLVYFDAINNLNMKIHVGEPQIQYDKNGDFIETSDSIECERREGFMRSSTQAVGRDVAFNVGVYHLPAFLDMDGYHTCLINTSCIPSEVLRRVMLKQDRHSAKDPYRRAEIVLDPEKVLQMGISGFCEMLTPAGVSQMINNSVRGRFAEKPGIGRF